MKRAVFLDRDGIIIKDTCYLNDPEKIIILPHAVRALKKLQDFGFILVIISNQSGVGRGYFKEAALHAINKQLLNMLKKSGVNITGVYYSTYYKPSKIKKHTKGAECRKPRAGMLYEAAKDLDIELSASYMIGDRDSDIGTGINGGLKGNIYVKSKYKYEHDEFVPDKKVKNPDRAADWIIKKELSSRIITDEKILEKLVRQIRKKKRKIVTTNGAFDILHIGHLRYLHECRRYGDVLIAGLNSNKSVRMYKPKNRPIIDQFARAEMLANLKPVDYVFIFNERDPREFLKIVKTDFHIKACDYTMDRIIEKKVVESLGGEVILIPYLMGCSVTNIIKKIKADEKKK